MWRTLVLLQQAIVEYGLRLSICVVAGCADYDGQCAKRKRFEADNVAGKMEWGKRWLTFCVVYISSVLCQVKVVVSDGLVTKRCNVSH